MTYIVAVDLCGTLVRENTTHGFLRSVVRHSWRRPFVNAALSRMGTWASGRLGVDARVAMLIPSLYGIRRESLYQCAVDYARNCLRTQANDSVIEAIAAAQGKGAKIVLATASLDPIASAFVRELNLDGVVSAQLAYDAQGKCLGRLAEDTTGRKLKYLSELMAVMRWSQFDVYTDNLEDLDLMHAAHRVYFLGNAAALERKWLSCRQRVTFMKPV